MAVKPSAECVDAGGLAAATVAPATHREVHALRVALADVATAGMLVLLAVAALERGLFFASNRLPFEVLLAMLAAVAAVDRGIRADVPLWFRGMDWAVLAFTLGYIVAWRSHPAAPDQARDRALLALGFLLWYWSAAHLLRGSWRLRLATNAVFASGVLLSVVGALAVEHLVNIPYAVLYDRVLSTLQYPNALAIWIVVATLTGDALMLDVLSRPASRYGQWWLGLYGGGAALMASVLVGTYSRGGWVVLLLGLALWLYGVPRPLRRDAAVVAGWPLLIGVLLSRAFLSILHGPAPLEASAVGASLSALAAAAVIGGAGPPAYRLLRRSLRRQRWSPALRRAVQASAVVYGGLMLLILVSAARSSARIAGQGVLGSTLTGRLSSMGSGGGSASTRFMLWWDAWRMIRRRPLLGYGGGGWAALYHQFQHMGYAISLVHSSVLQAWVDGGLLALAGLIAIGVLLFRRGWRMRFAREGLLLWGLAVAGAALWLHALIDFDLSIPALMLLLLMLAAAVRGERRVAGDHRPVPRAWVAAGVGVTGLCSVALLLYAQHFGFAQRLGAFAASAIGNHQYALAYQAGAEAVRLDPLSAQDQANLAQLLAAAYSVNGVASERRDALSAAAAAMRLNPGDLPTQVAMLEVALGLQDWATLQAWSGEMVNRFPLDPTAYQRVAAALITAAEAQLQEGQQSGVPQELALVASLPSGYQAAAARLGQGSPFGQMALTADVRLEAGQASLLLGQPTVAVTALQSLAASGNPVATGWLAAAYTAEGQGAAARQTLSGASPKASAATAFQAARHLLTLLSGPTT